MAFPVLAESKQTPYFTNLAKLSPTQGMVSFKFVGKNAPGSELTVGGMNTAAFTGQVAFSPVLTTQGQPPSFWTINMGQASVGGKPVQTTSQLATIDTGTSVVIAPQADAQAIYAAIPGSNLGQNGLFTYPCSANPDVALNFAGQNFNIKAADMSLGSDATNTTCVGAIVPSAQRNAWLVGDSFLKNVYTGRVGARCLNSPFSADLGLHGYLIHPTAVYPFEPRVDFCGEATRLSYLEKLMRLDDIAITGNRHRDGVPDWHVCLDETPWWALEFFRTLPLSYSLQLLTIIMIANVEIVNYCGDNCTCGDSCSCANCPTHKK
ncbi:Aspartic protease [Rhizoctonia solani AG-1 IB]|uniref:Aspartic protease n=1 Tax=Thanatephorus cucumeris (strain AG1-IB / isolate 7/3/14) TaxID=1108050 RepID=M5BX51_THACB|nr:Aspartic protease [Rhizoctonia solani AG-1 IB]